jgi:hypothetical protein
MSAQITKKLNEYATLNMTIAGKPYDFVDKSGKKISGIAKDSIKIRTPHGSITLLPSELKALLALNNDDEIQKEIAVRMT